MDVSVVIVNYNMKALVLECAASFDAIKTNVEYELIIVDNDSRDGSAAAIKEKYPKVKLVENKDNAGFARACNIGFDLAVGDNILFFNPDTEMKAGSLDVMLNYFKDNPTVGIIGCRNENTDGSEEPSVYRYPTLWRTFVDTFYLKKIFGGYEVPAGTYAGNADVEVICGACFMIRRSVIEQVGSFDNELWMYGEDVELCYRARKAGWRIVHLTDCSVIHKRGERHLTEDSHHDLARISYNHYRWIFHYYRKHCSALSLSLLRGMMFMQVYPKLWSRKRKFARGDTSKNNTERLQGLEKVYMEFIVK